MKRLCALLLPLLLVCCAACESGANQALETPSGRGGEQDGAVFDILPTQPEYNHIPFEQWERSLYNMFGYTTIRTQDSTAWYTCSTITFEKLADIAFYYDPGKQVQLGIGAPFTMLMERWQGVEQFNVTDAGVIWNGHLYLPRKKERFIELCREEGLLEPKAVHSLSDVLRLGPDSVAGLVFEKSYETGKTESFRLDQEWKLRQAYDLLREWPVEETGEPAEGEPAPYYNPSTLSVVIEMAGGEQVRVNQYPMSVSANGKTRYYRSYGAGLFSGSTWQDFGAAYPHIPLCITLGRDTHEMTMLSSDFDDAAGLTSLPLMELSNSAVLLRDRQTATLDYLDAETVPLSVEARLYRDDTLYDTGLSEADAVDRIRKAGKPLAVTKDLELTLPAAPGLYYVVVESRFSEGTATHIFSYCVGHRRDPVAGYHQYREQAEQALLESIPADLRALNATVPVCVAGSSMTVRGEKAAAMVFSAHPTEEASQMVLIVDDGDTVHSKNLGARIALESFYTGDLDGDGADEIALLCGNSGPYSSYDSQLYLFKPGGEFANLAEDLRTGFQIVFEDGGNTVVKNRHTGMEAQLDIGIYDQLPYMRWLPDLVFEEDGTVREEHRRVHERQQPSRFTGTLFHDVDGDGRDELILEELLYTYTQDQLVMGPAFYGYSAVKLGEQGLEVVDSAFSLQRLDSMEDLFGS